MMESGLKKEAVQILEEYFKTNPVTAQERDFLMSAQPVQFSSTPSKKKPTKKPFHLKHREFANANATIPNVIASRKKLPIYQVF